MSQLSAVDPPAPRTRSTLAFIIVASVLICAAALRDTVMATMQMSFRKEPVDTRLPLSVIKSELGPWVQMTIDRAQSADMEHELGTRQYIFRDYYDTRLLKPVDRDAVLKMSIEDRDKFYFARRGEMLRGRVYLGITYYTGGTDTVPHVADRCYVADGFKPSTYDVVTWPVLPRASDEAKNTQVRLINFIDQIDSQQRRPVQVAYFFQVNGAYEQDPVFGVRRRLSSLLQRRAYFAKIEVRTDLENSLEAAPIVKDFLQYAMPEVERVLPDPAGFEAGADAPTTVPVTTPATTTASETAQLQ